MGSIIVKEVSEHTVELDISHNTSVSPSENYLSSNKHDLLF